MDRRMIAVVGLAIAVLLAVVGIRGARQRMGAGANPAPVETAVVRQDTLEVTADATGAIAPASEVALGFQIGGKVADVLANEGDPVVAGQPLAVLDTRDLTLQWEAALGNRDAAGSAVAGARSALAQVVDGSSVFDVDSAKVNLDKAKDARWGAQAQRDGICGKVEHKRAEQDACDGAEAAVLQAEDGVRLAELQLAKAIAGPEAADVSGARSKVSQAGGQLDAAEAQAEQARLRLQQATLVSPVAGTVTSLTAKVGQTVGAGQAVATVSDLGELIVEVSLDQTDVAKVAVGQKAKITVDAFPEALLEGEITQIAPVADIQSGVVLYPVTVKLMPSQVAVRAGMTADVSIVLERKTGALVVPRQAIQADKDGYFVQIVNEGQAAQAGEAPRRVPIKLGATTETEAEVSSGVKAGDVVVVPPPPTRVPSGPFGGGSR